MKAHEVNRQKGFSLIEVLVVVAIIGVIATVMLDQVLNAQKLKRQLQITTMLENKRSQIGYQITYSKSRSRTLGDASNFQVDCNPGGSGGPAPLTASNCGSNYGGIANVLDENGNVVVDGLSPGSGFNDSGATCTGFDKSAGNAACSFKAVVRWVSPCVPTGTAGGCKNPDIFYEVSFLYSPQGNRVVLNPEKYRFDQNSFGVQASHWQIKSADFAAKSDGRYIVNTTGGTVRATLPAGPMLGDMVAFVDGAGTFDTHMLIISGNGQSIMGEPLGDEMEVDVKYLSFELVYYGNPYGWRLR